MATSRLCSISDCGKSSRSRGLCNPHYLRLLNHGDPLAGSAMRKRDYSPTCTVPGCALPFTALGLCAKHYRRLKLFGDPIGGKDMKTKRGELLRYYNEVVRPYEGDDCLLWPYHRGGRGYAQISIDGKTRYVSRMICEEEHGPPPTGSEEAAHSCGNGHLGCVARNHLRWATKLENEQDKIGHGTRYRSSRASPR
jgi:hypothetical protein